MKLARMDVARLVLALAVVVLAWTGVKDAPFLSEDWTHLAEARGDAGWWSAFDLAREPLRPLQHLVFHVLAGTASPDPTLARAASFALHVAACALVFFLALELLRGVAKDDAERTRAASGAALLFALAPNVKGLAWTAAISTPARAVFLLAALLAFARALRTGSRGARAAFVACFGLALLAHESAIVLPALCVAWAVCAPSPSSTPSTPSTPSTGSTRAAKRSTPPARAADELAPAAGLRAAFDRAVAALKRPELALVVLAALVYVVYSAFLRPERHHGLKSLDSLPANVVKASLALVPELVRANVVEFLRAHPGAGGLAGAGLLFAVLGALAAWILVRGNALARFALVAVALDLVLPVLSTGFTQRYAYFGSACAALALGAWAARTWMPWTFGVVLALGTAWGADQLRDVEEYAEAGRVATRVLESAAALRRGAPEGVPVAVVDAPDVWGAEADIPLFNWGLLEALERGGAGRGFVAWRTRAYHTGTDVELVTLERARAAEARGEAVLLRADAAFGAFRGRDEAVDPDGGMR